MALKARPPSTVKVPEGVPGWQTSLYRKIWRAAFLIIGDETKARQIATAVCMPPATKPSPSSLASVPGDVPMSRKSQWAKVAQKVEILTGDENAARQIAYAVTGKYEEDVPMPSAKSAPSTVTVSQAKPDGVLLQMPGGSVKATVEFPHEVPDKEGWVEGYLVSWGNERDTDLQGEFFSPRTNFCLDWFVERPVLYHHGMDGATGLKKIGLFKTVKADEMGLWVQAQLDLRDRYARAVYDMVKAKEFGWSSGSVDHLVKIGENGEILIWPLIEGSITPTPAQPAKTTVRPIKAIASPHSQPIATMQAYKALLSNDFASQDYLRGLEARVALPPTDASNPYSRNGVKTMGRFTDSSLYITSAVAKAFGLKDVSEDEMKAVADEVKDVVSDEVAAAAAEELETEAAMAALEEEMGVAPAAASYRGRGQRGYSYRQTDLDETTMQADDFPPAAASYRRASRGFGYRQTDLDEATMQDDLVDSAARAIYEKAWAKTMRRIKQTDAVDAPYLGTPASEQATPLASETMPGKFFGYRQADPDDVAQMSEDVISDVATQSYRRGFRSGLRSAYRQVDTEPTVMDDEMVAMDEAINAAENVGGGDAVVAEAARAYRLGYSKGLSKAMRQVEDETMMQMDDLQPAAASYRGRGQRGYGYRQAGTSAAAVTQDPSAGPTQYAQAPTGYAPVPEGGTLDNTKYYARRGYGYRQTDLDEAAMQADLDDAMAQLNDPTMMGDEAFMQADMDDPAMMQADFDESTMQEDDAVFGKNYTPRNRAIRSAGNYDLARQAEYWRNRAQSLEQQEAPGQRAFKSVGRITDEADRPGAYERAFKSYLIKGLAMLKDNEKYILEGKGKARWQNATFEFDNAQKSVKAYTSGSDASVGFLVPEDWVNELNKNVMTQTVMAGECRTRTTTSDRIVQPNLVTDDARRAHAAVVRWPGESPTSTESRTREDEYSQVTVPIHVMLLSLAATNSALEDSTFNLEEEINEAFSEAVAVAYDQLIWSGDGQGKLQGIVVNTQVIGAASTGIASVSGYIPTGSPDGLTSADVLKKMLFHLPQGYRQRCKWFMNSNTGLEVATLKDGEGNYLIDQRDESLRAVGIPDRLLGKPIVYNEWGQDVTEGNFPIVLADLSRGYIIGRRVEFSIRRFDDSTYAEQDQVLFLGRARLGGQVLMPAAIKVLKVAAS